LNKIHVNIDKEAAIKKRRFEAIFLSMIIIGMWHRNMKKRGRNVTIINTNRIRNLITIYGLCKIKTVEERAKKILTQSVMMIC